MPFSQAGCGLFPTGVDLDFHRDSRTVGPSPQPVPSWILGGGKKLFLLIIGGGRQGQEGSQEGHPVSWEQLVGVELWAQGPMRVPAPPPHRVNVGCGPAEERVLLTGLHAVADIYCENCKTTLGWKYVSDRGSAVIKNTFPVETKHARKRDRCCQSRNTF